MIAALLPFTSVQGGKPGSGPCVVEAGADCTFTLVVDGRHREYLLHVPDGYDGTPVPLVMDVHGYLSSPESQRSESGMYELSDIETFAVAYPRGGEGSRPKWWQKGFNGSDDWVDPGCCATASEENWDDVYCELDAPHVTYGATPLSVAEIFWDFFSRH
jgi:poly(3-hydroxybutyrate) depolymerase